MKTGPRVSYTVGILQTSTMPHAWLQEALLKSDIWYCFLHTRASLVAAPDSLILHPSIHGKDVMKWPGMCIRHVLVSITKAVLFVRSMLEFAWRKPEDVQARELGICDTSFAEASGLRGTSSSLLRGS